MPALEAATWECELYIGLPLLLLGLWKLFHLNEVRMRAVLAMGLVCLVLALGHRTLLFDLIYPLVPAMGMFRSNIRFAMFAVWAIILGGVCYWRAQPQQPLQIWRETAIVAACTFALAARWREERTLLWCGLAGLGVWVLLRGRAMGGARAGIRALLGLWLAIWLIDFVPETAKLEFDFRPLYTIPNTQGADFPEDIKQQLGPTTDPSPMRVFLPMPVLSPNSGMVNGYSMVAGYGSLSSARVWSYLHHMAGVQPSRLYNTFLDTRVHTQAPPFPYKGANVLIAWDRAEQRLMLCPPGELGSRAWLAPSILPVASEQQALELLVSGFDPRNGAVIEPDAQVLVAGCKPTPVAGSVQITAFSRNRIAMAVSAETTAVLVLAEAWFPGWQARVDGFETPVFPTNVWMRGIVVPTGTHEIEFSYRPTHFWSGFAISIFAIITWIAAWRQYKPPYAR